MTALPVRAEQVARDTGMAREEAAMLLNDCDNRRKWAQLDAELNDLMEVVEDGGD